jgi:HAD superfamily phosphatase (TIGR01668 family)
MLGFLTPHIQVESVRELSPQRLREWGLEALLLDVDCTLTRYRRPDVAPEVAAWLAELRAAGIGLCLLSNGGGRRIRQFAERLGLPYVAQALKPLPWRCRFAMRREGFSPEHTATVGDQLFADVLAGRLAGVKTLLVRPIHPEEEPWYTRLKRIPEQWILRRLGAGGAARG